MGTAWRARRPAVVPRLIGESCARWPSGFRHHLAHGGSAACSTVGHAAGLGYPPLAACDSAVCPDCRGRLSIGFQITADRFQAQVEYAYRTDRTQVLTTILWGGRFGDVSRRTLTDALRAAADDAHPVRIRAFAAAARDSFRHTSRILAARQKSLSRRGCFGHRKHAPLPDGYHSQAGPIHDELLAVTRDLRNHARRRPRLTVVEGAGANASLQQALSPLQELSDLLGDYLQHVLQLLTLPVGRHAIHAIILETRRAVDELAGRHTAGDVYVEELTVTESDDKAISLEVEGWLGAAVE